MLQKNPLYLKIKRKTKNRLTLKEKRNYLITICEYKNKDEISIFVFRRLLLFLR